MRLVRTKVAVEMLFWLPLLVDSNVLFQEESALKDPTAVQASVFEFWMVLLSVLVEVDKVPAAHVAGKLQVRLVVNDVILEVKVAFEG
jgi:hypothetical protein